MQRVPQLPEGDKEEAKGVVRTACKELLIAGERSLTMTAFALGLVFQATLSSINARSYVSKRQVGGSLILGTSSTLARRDPSYVVPGPEER